jgi:mRNA interferase MazF
VGGPRVPDRGDVVWVQLSPQAGSEQKGHRPALVLSPRTYNRKTGLVLMCPITSRVKGYPFEVVLPPGLKVEGAVLSDQVKSLDWRSRHATHFVSVPESVMAEVTARILALVDPEA